MLFLLSYATGGNLTHAQLDTNKLCKYTAKLLNWLLVSLRACVFLAFSLGWRGAAGEKVPLLIKAWSFSCDLIQFWLNMIDVGAEFTSFLHFFPIQIIIATDWTEESVPQPLHAERNLVD